MSGNKRYYCGINCPGHDSYSQDCHTSTAEGREYPGLKPFLDAVYLPDDSEGDTEPTTPAVRTNGWLGFEKSGGRATEEIEQYDNKALFFPPARQKAYMRR
jgi:hypothetical protein